VLVQMGDKHQRKNWWQTDWCLFACLMSYSNSIAQSAVVQLPARQEAHRGCSVRASGRSGFCSFPAQTGDTAPIPLTSPTDPTKKARPVNLRARPHAPESPTPASAERHGDQFLITVSDNGVGMPERSPQGLGQRLLRSLAEQVGGHIKTTTEAGKGTTRQLRFPARRS
jgi:hypothetical protein